MTGDSHASLNKANRPKIKWPSLIIDSLIENFFTYMILGLGLAPFLLLVLVYLALLVSPFLVDRYYRYVPLLQEHRPLAFTFSYL